jgi:hypothetical protein
VPEIEEEQAQRSAIRLANRLVHIADIEAVTGA